MQDRDGNDEQSRGLIIRLGEDGVYIRHTESDLL